MKFGYTILYVGDVAGSLAFYEAAFGLKTAMVHDSGTYAELSTGDTTLAFASREGLDATGKPTSPPIADRPVFEIALITHDVEAACQQAVAAGAREVSAAKEMPWGQIVAYVSDPDGFLVEICTPVGG